MLNIKASKKFRKDLKRVAKRGKNKEKLEMILEILAREEALSERYKDHSLTGNWLGNRECHIEPDWLLIYQINKTIRELYLVRTGSHSELF